MSIRIAAMSGVVMATGLLLVARALMPTPPPRLEPALERLTAVTSGQKVRRRALIDLQTLAAWGERVGWLRPSTSDLHLAKWSASDLLVRKAVGGIIGMICPIVLTIVLQIAGSHVVPVVPIAASLATAAIGFLLPDVELRRRAKLERRRMRRVVCAYLDLVALERAANVGPVESLESAATLSDDPGFTRIAEALEEAQLRGMSPWDGLACLGDEVTVPALVDVANIVRLSGEDGAAVYETLRAKARSLRSELLAEATIRANEDSERMVIPAALTVVVFICFIGYPFLARLLSG